MQRPRRVRFTLADRRLRGIFYRRGAREGEVYLDEGAIRRTLEERRARAEGFTPIDRTKGARGLPARERAKR